MRLYRNTFESHVMVIIITVVVVLMMTEQLVRKVTIVPAKSLRSAHDLSGGQQEVQLFQNDPTYTWLLRIYVFFIIIFFLYHICHYALKITITYRKIKNQKILDIVGWRINKPYLLLLKKKNREMTFRLILNSKKYNVFKRLIFRLPSVIAETFLFL